MDKLKIAERLVNKTGLSYEEVKNALEYSDWDILDALLYLEDTGKVQKPDVNIFYTNEFNNYSEENKKELQFIDNKKENRSESNSKIEWFFEAICIIIDTGNNILLEISRKNKRFINIPITVMILLLLFGFVIIIPLIIVGLFFDIQFKITSNKVNTNKVNDIINEITKIVSIIKDKFKGGNSNG